MYKYRYIKDMIVKNKKKYILGIFCILVVDFFQLVFPRVLGVITDSLKSGTMTKAGVARYAGLILLIAFGIALFRFLWRYLVLGAARSIEMVLRERFYAHLQRLSVNYYNHHKTGDLMAHATNDMNQITMLFGQGIALAVDSTIIPLVAIIMMFNTVGAKLTLAAFVPLLFLAGILALNVKIMHKRVHDMQKTFSDLTERARESFSGIRVIKAFAQEQKEIAKFEKDNLRNKQANLKYVRIMSMLFPTIMAVSALSFAIALWVGGMQVISGEITLGDYIAFNGYLMMMIWPIAALGWIVSIFQRGNVSLERVNAIMDEVPEIVDSKERHPMAQIKGKIELQDVSFTYPGEGKPALRKINLCVEEGKTLAIVGKTGSGKTTLISLLLRLYDTTEGAVKIDGEDIRKVPLSLLRESIGYVPQETFLFSSTIKENIDFFHQEEDGKIIQASKIAKVYDNIMAFPNQFDTVVGERGVTLSGGQKQRVAIARAIVKDPPILVLDDSLSAVDTQTEEEILKGLKEVVDTRTSVIVSHRISTIKDADEIVVLEEGEIIERGNHAQLLEGKGAYYELYQKQLLSEKLEGEE